MSSDNPRVQELRRRVQADPASIAFAQLAEECRRSGANDEAVRISRAGLSHHPDYLSARVTLGRALLELGRLDESQRELTHVLGRAHDNLPANRALAELLQKRGDLNGALTYYRRALQLSQFDEELEEAVKRIESALAPPAPAPVKVEAAAVSIEDLFDFDTLLEQLGGRTQPKESETPTPVPGAVDAVQLRADDADPFSVLEQQLRDREEAPLEAIRIEELAAVEEADRVDQVPAVDDPSPSNESDEHELHVMAVLEGWLDRIVADRQSHPSA